MLFFFLFAGLIFLAIPIFQVSKFRTRCIKNIVDASKSTNAKKSLEYVTYAVSFLHDSGYEAYLSNKKTKYMSKILQECVDWYADLRIVREGLIETVRKQTDGSDVILEPRYTSKMLLSNYLFLNVTRLVFVKPWNVFYLIVGVLAILSAYLLH